MTTAFKHRLTVPGQYSIRSFATDELMFEVSKWFRDRNYTTVEVKFRTVSIAPRMYVIDCEFYSEADYMMFLLRESPELYQIGADTYIK